MPFNAASVFFQLSLLCYGTFCVFLFHLITDEEGEAQVLQALVEVGRQLLVLPPGFLQPLGGDRDQSTDVS